MTIKTLQIKTFLNTGFKSFSTYDCVINIPNLMDGFKVSQRKAVYTLVTKNKKNTVERYSSEIAGYTCYHHGASNLEGVLVGLAQDYPTSNNVNFLTPVGQFGNILNETAAAGRYISVEPHDNFRKWFKKEDDIILKYEYEDGEQIEPVFYVPLVPTLLFNGSSGIATGYACKILKYNPKDIVHNVMLSLEGKKQKTLVPYFHGYAGSITKDNGQTVFTGTFVRSSSTTITVTALPIGHNLESYKAELAKLIDREIIKDYDDNSTKSGWNIVIYVNRAFTSLTDDVIIDKLKLVTRESENITVWTEDKKIKHFDSPEDLIEHFVAVRLIKYEERRQELIKIITEDSRIAGEKARFIEFYLANSDKFRKMKRPEATTLLLKEKFLADDISRLMNMSIWNLTGEEIDKLREEIKQISIHLKALQKETAKNMYMTELKALKI
jgi:DNA topoisomerase-2